MPERQSPREMCEQIQVAYPAISNSKARRLVQKFNTNDSGGKDFKAWLNDLAGLLQEQAGGRDRDFADWRSDPTGRRAVTHVHQQHPTAEMWQSRHWQAVRSINAMNTTLKGGSAMDLMTTEEAAAFLHVPIATLRHWIATSQSPPSARIGRRRMFRRTDLEKFVNAKFDAA